jgi:hypothetical protein
MATEMVLIPKSTYDEWKKSGDNTVDKGTKTSNYTDAGNQPPEEAIDSLKKSYEDNNDNNIDILSAKKNDKLSANKNDSQHIDADILEDMLDEFPLNYRLYAKRLLQYIKKSGGDVIKWKNDDTTLIYRGTPQVGSDIIELVNYIFKTNSRKPKGLEVFNIGLKAIKTPKAYLKPYLLRPPGIPKSIKKKWVKY